MAALAAGDAQRRHRHHRDALVTARERLCDRLVVEVGRRRFGQHGGDRQPLGNEVALRDAQQIVGGRAAHRFEVDALLVGIARQHLEGAELAGLAGDALALEVLAGEKVHARLVEFVGGDRLAAHPVDLARDRFERGRAGARRRDRRRRRRARVERRVAGAVDAIDGAVALLHAAHQPAALAFAEHEREQVEVRRVGVRESDGGPGEFERRALEGTPQQQRAHFLLRRLDRAIAARARGLGAFEGARELCGERRRLEVAARHDEQVVGRVPAPEEALHLLAVEGRDTLSRVPRIGAR